MNDFRGVSAKIERASEQTQTLRSEMDELCSAIKQGVKEEFHGDAGEQRWVYCGERSDVPIAWSIRIGEILHNLRSALDHLVWQLVLANGQKPEHHNGFPICSDKQVWLRECPRKLQGVSDAIKNEIYLLQPFKAAVSHPLLALRELHNIDKHRHLNLCAAFPEARTKVDHDVQRWPQSVQEIKGTLNHAKIETGTVVCRIETAERIPELKPFRVVVSFEELTAGASEKFKPVPVILEECHEAVMKADKRLRDHREPEIRLQPAMRARF